MANTKITERDIYNSILDGTYDVDVLAEFAARKLAQLDKRNESAARRAAAKREAGDAMVETVFAYVTDEPQTRGQIADAMIADGHDVTAAKVGARLNKLISVNRIGKDKAKFEGENGKPKTSVVYFAI